MPKPIKPTLVLLEALLLGLEVETRIGRLRLEDGNKLMVRRKQLNKNHYPEWRDSYITLSSFLLLARDTPDTELEALMFTVANHKVTSP